MKLIYIIECLIINNIRMFFIKLFNFNRFKYNIFSLISPSVSIDIKDNGKIFLGKKIKIRKNCTLSSKENSILKIGENCFFNNNCLIATREQINIGNNTIVGPNVVIIDHDHLFNKNENMLNEFKKDPVEIGENVWIGANCVILKGSKIGKNCIIGAGTIVNGIIEENSILYQKRENIIKKKR